MAKNKIMLTIDTEDIDNSMFEDYEIEQKMDESDIVYGVMCATSSMIKKTCPTINRDNLRDALVDELTNALLMEIKDTVSEEMMN